MTTSLELSTLLEQLAQQLEHHGHWQRMSPSIADLSSTEPFAIDTLSASEWLQWIFIPKMNYLIENNKPTPKGFSIAPYIEEALKDIEGYNEIVRLCHAIDALGK
ncbi:tRNA pseudouridine synthase C [Aliivibrio fischeri MJ11]|uniref:tRNA pseudouridine synthase C n=1 Tax=Aliivibrio fischeri (strain MJ11) TaxID=388396 RepID=B5FAV5_ALIFM|nr:YqcC family protein [Aliivibrio fischeri]ACH65950.1 tRNA pseudouridine synthase C [Aliivibrio fischeri MJ11]OCH40648.1 pseudouridine synthase [Aliivibrio fischeri]